MPWRNSQALHIFVPTEQPMENWVEQILGTVVRPLNEEFGSSIRWMWVTRYIQDYVRLPGQIKSYFGHDPIPDHYLIQGPNPYRYIVFRLSVEEEKRQELHQMALDLTEAAGLYVVPWADYDVVGDLGMDRFIHEGADGEKRDLRAKLVANFVDATVRLMLHSLIEEKGQWKLEPNTHEQNPDGSFFQSVHHLFCNATDVPTNIYLGIQPARYPGLFKFPVKF